MMVHMRMAMVLVAISLLAISNPAAAQWVSFSDETGSSLTLNAFEDNPGGNPLNDNQEKDIAVGDFDKDGWTDVIAVRKKPFSSPGQRQDVLLMNENGVLIDRTDQYALDFIVDLTDARDIWVGDVNGDGWLDLFNAATFGDHPRIYINQGNDGSGSWQGFADETSTRLQTIIEGVDTPERKFCAVIGGDITGNGLPDILLANYHKNTGITTKDVLYINDGNGNFTIETDARLGEYANSAFNTAVGIEDLDNDGDNDIVKISTLYNVQPWNGRVQVNLYNDGTGVFKNISFQNLPVNQPYMFDIQDFNGDGLLDQYLQGDNQDRVIIAQSVNQNNVNYQMTVLNSSRTSEFGGNVHSADIDNDGDLDIGIAPIDVDIQNCGGSQEFTLLQNPGNGIFFDPWPNNADQNFHIQPHDWAFIDINKDGLLDMFMGTCTGWKVFIQINDNQAPVAEANGPYSSDIGVTVNFSSADSHDPDGNIVSYEWDFGDGSPVSNVANPTHSYSASGIYTATLTVTDDDGAIAVDTASVSIASGGTIPPVAEANGPYSNDVGAQTFFISDGSFDPDGTIVAYEWDFGDGSAVNTIANPRHSYNTAGEFTAKVKVTDNDGLFAIDTTLVIVGGGVGNQLPIAEANGPYSANVGVTVKLSSAGSNDPDGTVVGYSWDFGDGSNLSAATNPRHKYTSAGTFTATLTVMDSDGATGTDTAIVTIGGGWQPGTGGGGQWAV